MQKSIEKLSKSVGPSIVCFAIIQFTVSVVGPVVVPTESLAQKSAQENRPAQPESLYKSGTEFSMGDPALPNPLTAYGQYADPKSYAAVEPNQTPGCKNLEVWEPVVVSRNHWNSIASQVAASSYVGVLAVVADVNCVKLGHPAHVAELNAATGIMTTLGWFMPTGLVGERPEYKEQEDRIRISAGLLGFQKPVVFVSGRIIHYNRATSGKRYAPRMVGVRMITRKQMESAIHDGTQIIDVRSKRQFSAAHVKGAVHVPYTVGPRMKIFDQYANYVKAGDAFDFRRVNQDKQKPVILMSEGPYADNVYRAAVVLRSEGWKQIYIFYEGFDYFTRMLWKPPAASTLFGSIQRHIGLLEEVEAMGAKLIDVRTPAEFAEGTIPGAVNLPYIERDDLRLRRPALNAELLRQYGDQWNHPDFPYDRAVIVFGSDADDWRAYKAALFLQMKGYRTYWFNIGFDAWEAVTVAGNQRFRIARSGAQK